MQNTRIVRPPVLLAAALALCLFAGPGIAKPAKRPGVPDKKMQKEIDLAH